MSRSDRLRPHRRRSEPAACGADAPDTHRASDVQPGRRAYPIHELCRVPPGRRSCADVAADVCGRPTVGALHQGATDRARDAAVVRQSRLRRVQQQAKAHIPRKSTRLPRRPDADAPEGAGAPPRRTAVPLRVDRRTEPAARSNHRRSVRIPGTGRGRRADLHGLDQGAVPGRSLRGGDAAVADQPPRRPSLEPLDRRAAAEDEAWQRRGVQRRACRRRRPSDERRPSVPLDVR